MGRFAKSLLVVVAALLLAAPVLAAHHAVKMANKEGIGSFLTDTEGKALYWFTKDSPGKSACAGQCLEKWPLYFRDTVAPPAGLKAEEFGTITREEGAKQTTFRGYPLYYWVNDKVAGDTLGQGVNSVWYVIDPANFPPQPKP